MTLTVDNYWTNDDSEKHINESHHNMWYVDMLCELFRRYYCW